MSSVTFKTIGKPKNIKYLSGKETKTVNFTYTNYPKVVLFNETLPFKVRFSSVGIPSRNDLIPPIGIAIIGINNYIL